MKTFPRVLISFIAIGAFAVVVGFSGSASAENQGQSRCASFPKVAWWGKMSHQRVIRYVNRKYGGDWKRYTAKWKRQLKVMVDIYDRDGTAIIKKRDIKLNGDKLENYIISVVRRVSVTSCLAAADSTNDFETAAGGEGTAGK